MPRGWVSWTLFLSSFTPLFLLLAVRSLGQPGAEPVLVGSVVLAVAGAIGTILFLMTARRIRAGDYEVVSVESRDADVAAYTTSYLLPFVTIFDGGWRDQVSLMAFVVLLGFIYVRSRLIYVNPVLFILGYRLSRVMVRTAGSEGDPSWPKMLLSDSGPVIAGERLRAFTVNADLLMVDRRDRE